MADSRPDLQLIGPRLGAAERIAFVVSVVWIVVVGLFFLIMPPVRAEGDPIDSLRIVLIVIAIFMPVAMVWLGVVAARSAQIMRAESHRMQKAVDNLQSFLADKAGAGVKGGPTVEKKLDEIAQTAKKTEAALATFATSRVDGPGISMTSVRSNRKAEDQPSLAFETKAEDMTPPLSRINLVRALNFPDTDQDSEGFAALRLALKDRVAKQLVQAAQDILTLLSQDGIYMDDLRPDRARPEIWRRFAQGERGRAMAGLGGVHDRSSLALTAGRMREDTIFRDTAHHFLRKFDQMLVAFEDGASDADLIALSETRSARAFMLLGRVTGTFD